MFEADGVKMSCYDSVLSNTVGVVYSATGAVRVLGPDALL
jgi:hypothetical protein